MPSSTRARSCRTTTIWTSTPPGAPCASTTNPACVIVKHLTPCGVCQDDDLVEAYQRAHACDPVSAYGGVMAFNRPVTRRRGHRHLREQAVRGMHHRARVLAGCARHVRRQEERAPAVHRRREPGRRGSGVPCRRGRRAVPGRRRRARRPRRVHGAHQAQAYRSRNGRAHVRLEGVQVGEVQRHRSSRRTTRRWVPAAASRTA